MSLEIITKIENYLHELKAHFSPEVQADIKAVQNAGHDIVHSAVDYLKTKGLEDAYTLATTLLAGPTGGGSWGVLLGSLIAEAAQMGKELLHQDAAIVLGQAQADLIAVGKIAAPTPAA